LIQVLDRARRRKELQEENERSAFERHTESAQGTAARPASPDNAKERPSSSDDLLCLTSGGESSAHGGEDARGSLGGGGSGRGGASGVFAPWLFLGCDQEGCAVVFGLSAAVAACGGALVGTKSLKTLNTPVGALLLCFGGAGLGLSALGWGLLGRLNKQAAIRNFQGGAEARTTLPVGAAAGVSLASSSGSDGAASGYSRRHNRGSITESVKRQWTELTGLRRSVGSSNVRASIAVRMKVSHWGDWL
jgi:hypothetical protein